MHPRLCSVFGGDEDKPGRRDAANLSPGGAPTWTRRGRQTGGRGSIQEAKGDQKNRRLFQ